MQRAPSATTGPGSARKSERAVAGAAVLAVLVAAGIGLWSYLHRVRDELPTYFAVRDFSLVDQRGHAYGSKDLAGKVVVYDFIFTSCPDVCPRLTSDMRALTEQVTGDDVRFVSVTVDPETDTPEVLAQHAASVAADPQRWVWLSGEPSRVRAVINEGFKQPVGERFRTDAGAVNILHSGKFVLVDRAGNVRGLYDSDPDSRAELLAAIESL